MAAAKSASAPATAKPATAKPKGSAACHRHSEGAAGVPCSRKVSRIYASISVGRCKENLGVRQSTESSEECLTSHSLKGSGNNKKLAMNKGCSEIVVQPLSEDYIKPLAPFSVSFLGFLVESVVHLQLFYGAMSDRMNEQVTGEEYFDVLTKTGEKTGISKPRGAVHRDGDYHRAVHVWIFAESTQELVLQRRAECKDSWAGLWDISSAGHISAGDSSLVTASILRSSMKKDAVLYEVGVSFCLYLDNAKIVQMRELHEELGIKLPKDAFELLFVFLQEWLVTEIAILVFCYTFHFKLACKEDPQYVPYDVNGQYGQLFEILSKRYKQKAESRALVLQKKLNRYARVSLDAELTGLSNADKEALSLIVKAAKLMDKIFFVQVWFSNPSLRDWLELHADESQLNKIKWIYYLVNKSPWSSLDENEAFLTTGDSAVKLLPEATKPVTGWKGVEYRKAFPVVKPPGANFYPPDMDKMEFEIWKNSLPEEKQKEATGFFSVIKRKSERVLDESLSLTTPSSTSDAHDLYIVPYSEEYNAFLTKASDLLHKAGDLTSSSSLKKLLHSKPMPSYQMNTTTQILPGWNWLVHGLLISLDTDSKLDITIGPYETYEDTIFGYKATFEAFIAVRDDEATAQVKLFGDHLQVLEKNLPMDSVYKLEDVIAAPIRVVQLIYNAGDVKGLFLTRFKLILQPISHVCISEEQRKYVDLTLSLLTQFAMSVAMELQELHSALEEAKADIVGLWALRFLVNKNILPNTLIKSMYVSFLAGCFRSVRFGLEEAHGKGQALQFNYLFEKGAFVMHGDGTFSVDFDKVEDAVESLSREILTIQGKGDKGAANSLLLKHCVMTPPLKSALDKLEMIKVPVDILPDFPIADEILSKSI
ncbi:hypothetical protein DH2020_049296 [Rehmannia glutinosa]|uniref:Nudix hydrolase domain-containing protein n=1 Tax=Rehmannia glutinosa TaxID=99300 RepID=A0ABR0U3Z1_REHGL